MKSILVVDDEPDIRESVKMILEREGYSVITAVDGKDCLDKLIRETPDLILLDVMMPGTSIKDITAQIKKIKIAFLSVVRTSEAEKQDLLNQKNIVDYIQKPFDVHELIQRVDNILTGRRKDKKE